MPSKTASSHAEHSANDRIILMIHSSVSLSHSSGVKQMELKLYLSWDLSIKDVIELQVGNIQERKQIG